MGTKSLCLGQHSAKTTRRTMTRVTAGLAVFLFCGSAQAQSWHDAVARQIPFLGHRNWILIVDSAYPLQVSPGIETIDTGAAQLQVLQDVLQQIGKARHVRPVLFEDKELAFVPEQDAPGVEAYRQQLRALLGRQPVQVLPHEEIISRIDEAGKTFRVLILKTTLTIPYTSVFVQLDCRYWSTEAENRLRQSMKEGTR